MFLRKDFPLAFDNALPIGQNVEHILIGVVAERFKAHAWKACWGECPSRVRIPPTPPLKQPALCGFFITKKNAREP